MLGLVKAQGPEGRALSTGRRLGEQQRDQKKTLPLHLSVAVAVLDLVLVAMTAYCSVAAAVVIVQRL